MLPIETKNPLFGLYLYPEAKEMMEEQQDKSWTAQEIPVDKDRHMYRHVLSSSQLHLTTTTLQIFVEIEQKVGEVWDKIGSWFPHSEIEGCSAEIARMEKSVHAFFYQKMSDVLNIDPKETANIQQEVQALKCKLEFLTSITSNLDANKALSLATLAIIEQVLLFSNFAMLKSFQDAVIDYTFSGSISINDVSPDQLKVFIRSRANEVLGLLGLRSDYYKDLEINPIADWFYKGTTSIKMHDFFVSGTSQYRRSWKMDSFSRLPFIKENNE